MSFHHFNALLKKNLLILKSTYILTFFEIFTPTITMLILLLTNSKFETEQIPIKIDSDYIKNNCSLITDQYHLSDLCKFNDYTLVLRCNDSLIVLIGEEFPHEIRQRIENIFRDYHQRYPEFRNYKSFLELKDYIESKNYEKMTKVCFGISYEKLDRKYIFKLHYFASKFIKPEKNVANIPSTNIDNLDPFRVKADFESYEQYKYSGFLMVQKILYDYILRKETDDPNAEIYYRIIPEKYEEKTFNFISGFLYEIVSVFILLAYAFPLCLNVYKLIKEKESRAKEIMKMMGLDELSYFFSYFIIYFVINLIQALLNALITKYVLNYIEYAYLFILFFLYGLVIFSLVFFFQSFLEKANISIVFSLLVYAIFYILGIPLKSNRVNKSVKILFALLFPPVNLYYGCNTMNQFQSNYNEFNGRTNMIFQKYSVKDMYILFVSNFILYMLLGFYLQNIIQHEYGTKKPWYFLCTKNFWNCKSEKDKIEEKNFLRKSLAISRIVENDKSEEINININNEKFEGIKSKDELNDKNDNIDNDKNTEVNDDNNIKLENKFEEGDGIFHVKNIKKDFGEKQVLKGVSFDLLPNEIFVLLGHNGAGKTTLISILTGLINADSGSAMFNNYNVLSQENSEYFRKILGICPQHDVLFNDLTVEEHLELFYQFKSINNPIGYPVLNLNISEEITKIIKQIDLEDKRTTRAGDLSGGQKRKLSIGLALVGGSKIIFLDEPTSGMDITARRNLWDILKKCSNGKIIILTTHFMEEASELGDKIGILSEGKMQRIGTPLELIGEFTNYVNLNVTKHSGADVDEIITFIFQILGGNELEFYNFNRDILFRIARPSRFDWSKFFELLDDNIDKLKIKSYSISKTTLEDVFMKFSKIKNKKDFNEAMVNLNEENKNHLRNSQLLFNENNYEKENNNNMSNNKSRFCKDFRVSFKKRFLQIKRDKKTLILEILCPILLTLVGCLVGFIELLEPNKAFPLHLNQITNDTQIIYYNGDMYGYFSNLDNYISKNTNAKFESINAYNSFNNDKDIIDDIKELYKIKNNKEVEEKEKSFVYYRPSFIDEAKNQFGFNIIIDITARQAAPIYADFLMNNVVRNVVNRINRDNYYYNDIEIEMINEPFQFTYEEKKEKKNRNQFLILFFIALAFSLIPSNFITLIIKERENNSKHLQIISGISLFSYWFNNYAFELIKYFVIGGICILFLLAFDFYEKYLVILYLEYGPAMISFTYLFSILLKSEYMGQIIVLLINLILGCIFAIAVMTMRLYEKLIDFADNLSYVLRIIPSFCFCYGYNQLIRKNELYILDEHITIYDKVYFEKSENDNIISLKHVGVDCLYLAIESLIYLIILIILENTLNKSFCKREINMNELNKYNIQLKDKDLNKSRLEINENDVSIKVEELVKIYNVNCCKEKVAVKNISFKLAKGDIFGFLGTNGAGKTTTFKCLSNEIFPSHGKICFNNKDIIQDFNEVRNLIGYCPQFDTIFEFLTVYENLEFYGIIKGAKREKLNDIIESLMEEMHLLEFRDKISGTLSGGNKRKLSVAIALICNPEIILLDEPSTGMDPEARRQMWEVIHNISANKKNATIIMTTHVMEEAESLCKKIGILVNGEFKCYGTSDEIKEECGYGFEIKLQIKIPDINKLFEVRHLESKDIEAKIYLSSFDDGLKEYGLDKYKDLFDEKSFGKKLKEELINKGYIKLKKIIFWDFYLKSSIHLMKKLKEYFEEINCVFYKDNHFVFRIKRNKTKEEKSIGFLFGLIEGFKYKYNIEQYSLQYSSLEQIFNSFTKEIKGDEINIEIDQEIMDCFY